jgi:hypothetical protein
MLRIVVPEPGRLKEQPIQATVNTLSECRTHMLCGASVRILWLKLVRLVLPNKVDKNTMIAADDTLRRPNLGRRKLCFIPFRGMWKRNLEKQVRGL